MRHAADRPIKLKTGSYVGEMIMYIVEDTTIQHPEGYAYKSVDSIDRAKYPLPRYLFYEVSEKDWDFMTNQYGTVAYKDGDTYWDICIVGLGFQFRLNKPVVIRFKGQ